MKDAECTDQNGKNNKKILQLLFFELSRNFIENWGDDVTKMAKNGYNSKIKMGKI